MNNNKVLVYGSLRKGMYNYDSFDSSYPGEIDYIKTLEITGYKLYSLGSYPAIYPSDDDRTLVVDLLEVSDKVKNAFDRMEIGAGYKIEKVLVDDELIDIYVYRSLDWLDSRDVVEDGDWVNYMTKKYSTYA